MFLFAYDLFMFQNLHSYFLSHFSHPGNRKNRYLSNMPRPPTENPCGISEKGVRKTLPQLGSFRKQRHHHMTHSHPGNVCALYEKGEHAQPCNKQASRRTGALFRIPQQLLASVILVPVIFLSLSVLIPLWFMHTSFF